MFKREKCSQCEKKVGKKFDFCPYCGFNLRSRDDGDYGFLGKNDLEGMKLPFGFNALFKPLMKELTKQMSELDREMRQERSDRPEVNKKPVTSFSIHIGGPGQRPIRLNPGNLNINQPVRNNVMNNPVREIILPKVSSDVLKKSKDLEKVEPETSVRRLADKVSYEIVLPGVDSIKNINVSKLEIGIEIKAFSKDKVFVKTIELEMPLVNYFFEKEKLVLELGLK